MKLVKEGERSSAEAGRFGMRINVLHPNMALGCYDTKNRVSAKAAKIHQPFYDSIIRLEVAKFTMNLGFCVINVLLR